MLLMNKINSSNGKINFSLQIYNIFKVMCNYNNRKMFDQHVAAKILQKLIEFKKFPSKIHTSLYHENNK